MQKPSATTKPFGWFASKLAWGMVLIQVLTLGGLHPALAQTADSDDNAASLFGVPANLEFTSSRNVLQTPFDSSSPDLSTTNLVATVRDAQGNLLKGIVVVFGSGDEVYADISGSVEDIDTRLTNDAGIATNTYIVDDSGNEGMVRLWAYAVIDPKLSAYSQTNLISRALQVTVDNKDVHTDPNIDATAGAAQALEQQAANSSQPAKTAQDLMNEVAGSNSLRVEMDATITAADNAQTPPDTWEGIGINLRAAASRALGGNSAPPNLGLLSLQYSLESDDQNPSAANLKSTSQNVFLPFTQNQTSSQGSDAGGSNTITSGGQQSLQNVLYLNSRAWGSRNLQIRVQLISRGSTNQDQLASQFSRLDDGSFLLADKTISFAQTNPDKPILKLNLSANPTEAKAGAKMIAISGILTANGEPIRGNYNVIAESSDKLLGRLNGQSGRTDPNGNFKFYYYPAYDDQEREITFTITNQVTDTPNMQVDSDFDELQSNFALKQQANSSDEPMAELNKQDDTRILLGTKTDGRFTLNLYGNRENVVALPYFEGRNTFSLGGGDQGSRGTTISELSVKNGYRNGPASYVILDAEVLDGQKKNQKVVSDPVSGFSTGRVISAIDSKKSNLMAAENAQTQFFLQAVPTSVNLLAARIDETSQKATFYYAPGDVQLKSGQTSSAQLTFSFKTIKLDIPMPIISKYDYTGDDKNTDEVIHCDVGTIAPSSASPGPSENLPTEIVEDAQDDPTWNTNGRTISCRFSAPAPAGAATVQLSASQEAKWFVQSNILIQKKKPGEVFEFNTSLGQTTKIYFNTTSHDQPVDINITYRVGDKGYTKKITVDVSAVPGAGDGGGDNSGDESGDAGDEGADGDEGSDQGSSDGSKDGIARRDGKLVSVSLYAWRQNDKDRKPIVGNVESGTAIGLTAEVKVLPGKQTEAATIKGLVLNIAEKVDVGADVLVSKDIHSYKDLPFTLTFSSQPNGGQIIIKATKDESVTFGSTLIVDYTNADSGLFSTPPLVIGVNSYPYPPKAVITNILTDKTAAYDPNYYVRISDTPTDILPRETHEIKAELGLSATAAYLKDAASKNPNDARWDRIKDIKIKAALYDKEIENPTPEEAEGAWSSSSDYDENLDDVAGSVYRTSDPLNRLRYNPLSSTASQVVSLSDLPITLSFKFTQPDNTDGSEPKDRLFKVRTNYEGSPKPFLDSPAYRQEVIVTKPALVAVVGKDVSWFNRQKPLNTSFSVIAAIERAQDLLVASAYFSDKQKDDIKSRIISLKTNPYSDTPWVYIRGVISTLKNNNKSIPTTEIQKLYRITADLKLALERQKSREGSTSTNYSEDDKRLLDQTGDRILATSNAQTITDTLDAFRAVKSVVGDELIAQYKLAGLYNQKVSGVFNTIFNIGPSNADTSSSVDATAPVSIWTIFADWLGRVLRVR